MRFADILMVAAQQRGGSSELVTNGGFADSTGWTVGSNWTISGGQATHSGPSGNLTRTAAATLVPGTYRCTFTVVSRTGGTMFPMIGGTEGTGVASTGAQSEDIVVASVTDQLVGMRGNSTISMVIDNLSIIRIA